MTYKLTSTGASFDGGSLIQGATSRASSTNIELSSITGNVVEITGTSVITNMFHVTPGKVYYFYSTDVAGCKITHGNNIFCHQAINIQLSGNNIAIGAGIATNKILIR